MDNNRYLQPSFYINWQDAEIQSIAKQLAGSDESAGISNGARAEGTIRACFEFVRDEIRHSSDYKVNRVTVRASDVLQYETGYCFAKSHLLAALLRANGIPTGLAYQRLLLDQATQTFCLHGLNAVYLQNHGWHRIDARGNKAGIDTVFDPAQESLAFAVDKDGEFNLPEIYLEPLSVVVDVLNSCSTFSEVDERLPDFPQSQR